MNKRARKTAPMMYHDAHSAQLALQFEFGADQRDLSHSTHVIKPLPMQRKVLVLVNKLVMIKSKQA